MARQKDLRSDDVNKLGDIINALESVVGQMAESFTSLESQTTGMSDKVSTLQSDMSIGRTSLQTDLKMLRELKESVATYVSEICNKRIGYIKKGQSEYLQENLSTFESIKESLESIISNLENQNKNYDDQSQVIEKLQYDWAEEKSKVDEQNKSLQSFISDARESLLVATVESIGWSIFKARKAIGRRMRWLWFFMCLVIIGAITWMVFGPTWSAGLIAGNSQGVSNLSGWEYLLLSRIGLLAILSAPYVLLKKSLDSTSEEARLYQHKEVMLKTLIVFRDSLDEEDQTVKGETINKMIEAISIPPSSKMSGEADDRMVI